MVVGTLGVFFHRELPRKLWAGYAICGWFYLVVHFGPWFRQEMAPFLFTTACLDLIYPHVAAVEQKTAMADPASDAVYGLAGGFGASTASPRTIWEHWTRIDGAGDGFNLVNDLLVTRSTSFELIGHALLALLFAYVGGLTTRRFAKLGATQLRRPDDGSCARRAQKGRSAIADRTGSACPFASRFAPRAPARF
jgi:hypothetical protein